MLEAYVIKGLFQQSRISTFIDGEYLNGVVGKLPASRLVRILVNDDAQVADGGLPKRGNLFLWAALAMVALEVGPYWLY